MRTNRLTSESQEDFSNRKIVIINQAVNYLTIGLANAFQNRFQHVALITGSIHVQGESLSRQVEVSSITKWAERPAWRKLFSYVAALLQIFWLLVTRYRRYEVFFVSLPPMAYLLTTVLPHRCSMLVWDVYPDVFRITGMSENHMMYRTWSRLNRIAFRKAFALFTIGGKMAEMIAQYVNPEKIIVQPIWSIFQENSKVAKCDNPFVKQHHLDEKFIVQYSGNIGLTHKVEVMVDLAEKMAQHHNILFQIIGRGPRMPFLQKIVSEKNLPNCQFLPFQSDDMFPYSLSAADLGIVILDEQTSKGSVPSKSYNLMSFGIPALYIADQDSELFEYAQKYDHAFCCRESELDQAADFILALSRDRSRWKHMSQNAEHASTHFRRDNADKFVMAYLNLE